MESNRTVRFLAIVTIAATFATVASAQWQIENAEKKQSLKFGLLAQGRADFTETVLDGEDITQQDLYLRRLRILMGGTFGDRWSFFLETDNPNLGKADSTGKKGASDIYIQDAVLTYSWKDNHHVDVGMLLCNGSHNMMQGATTLLPVDYGPYSFVSSTPMDLRVGRDYGVRARGYPLDKHLEYRVEVLQGNRSEPNRPLRTTGRVVWYPFEAETGLFYSGTNFGKKKLLAIGATYDTQSDYDLMAADVYWDWPIGKNGLTLQADWITEDGGDVAPSLTEQDLMLVEGAFHFNGIKLSPFVQYQDRNFDDDATADQSTYQVGLAWWWKGHNRNLKVGWGQSESDGGDSYDSLQVQLQVLQF
jgi:hypothetical protein